MMPSAPRSMRLHIGIFGRRNVGKSSLLNAITRQEVSIVSEQAGTTTDPVEKPMELLPLGPVLFIDTAGIDDEGALGELRVQKTRKVIERTDVALLVAEAESWGSFEENLLREFLEAQIPTIVVFNKVDLSEPGDGLVSQISDLTPPAPLSRGARGEFPPSPCGRGGVGGVRSSVRIVTTAATMGKGIADLRQALLESVPPDFLNNPAILGDLVPPGGLAVLVVPIDKEAPKGRLILPQVQAIRDLLDSDACCMVVKERELRHALDHLKVPPDLVVTDSQAFLKVVADTPPEVPVTSFSILFSRFKGDLLTQVEGALAVDQLRTGDRVLVSEACSHHPIGEDIGRVKIPRWLTQYVGGKLEFTHVQGHDFPEDLSEYKLVIHCGACMLNRREMLTRILRCREAGVPVSNYGLVIAFSLGIFERALAPFPAARDLYRQHREKGRNRP